MGPHFILKRVLVWVIDFITLGTVVFDTLNSGGLNEVGVSPKRCSAFQCPCPFLPYHSAELHIRWSWFTFKIRILQLVH